MKEICSRSLLIQPCGSLEDKGANLSVSNSDSWKAVETTKDCCEKQDVAGDGGHKEARQHFCGTNIHFFLVLGD